MGRVDAEISAAGLPPLDRRAWVEVDLDVLTSNAAALRGMVAPAALGIVVKADGYGHGLEMAARSAIRGGAEWLCVATAAEAVRLREDGYSGRVFVLYPVPVAQLPKLAHLDIDASVGSIGDAEAVARLGDEAPRRVHIEIDTGMTRGGIAPGSAAAGARILGDRVVGVWTHLASPERPESNRIQVDRFEAAREMLRQEGVEPELAHVAASGGVAAGVAGGDLVRVGLSFYGYQPFPSTSSPGSVEPALGVKARPVRVTTVDVGTRAGYGGEWTASRPSTVATVPIGYADGWARSTFEGGGLALVGGRVVPMAGRVSSDSVALDVTEAGRVDTNSEVVLLGRQGDRQITADDVAGHRKTISWEVLQQLGARLPRVYRSGGSVVGVRGSHTTDVTVTAGSDLTGPY